MASTSCDGDSAQQSTSGLERFIPRTSTPYPDDSHVTADEEWFAPYGIFRRILENPPKKARVRGLDKVPAHFITGHLIKSKKSPKFEYTTIFLDSRETVAPSKWNVRGKLKSLKKILRNFFRKYYRVLIRNKCDYSICPVTCGCQEVKSLLNKTIVLDVEAVDCSKA